MNLPRPLPARLYLLAFDTTKNRPTGRGRLGTVVRAAALADLHLDGRLTDDRGRPRAVPGAAAPEPDPVLDALVQRIAEERPRSWQHWVRADEHRTLGAVRDRLEAAGWIRVERRTFLPDRVRLREPHRVKRYAGTVRAGLSPGSHPDPRDATALALAATGELTTVITRSERRRHHRRLEELADGAWPAVRALKRAIQAKRAVTASGG